MTPKQIENLKAAYRGGPELVEFYNLSQFRIEIFGNNYRRDDDYAESFTVLIKEFDEDGTSKTGGIFHEPIDLPGAFKDIGSARLAVLEFLEKHL